MATPKLNHFAEFDLSDQERISGQTLNMNQIMILQNLRAEYAHKKLNLTYDPINPQVFLQQEAEIMGWVNCITYVLDCNEAARIEAVAAANNNNGQS